MFATEPYINEYNSNFTYEPPSKLRIQFSFVLFLVIY